MVVLLKKNSKLKKIVKSNSEIKILRKRLIRELEIFLRKNSQNDYPKNKKCFVKQNNILLLTQLNHS